MFSAKDYLKDYGYNYEGSDQDIIKGCEEADTIEKIMNNKLIVGVIISFMSLPEIYNNIKLIYEKYKYVKLAIYDDYIINNKNHKNNIVELLDIANYSCRKPTLIILSLPKNLERLFVCNYKIIILCKLPKYISFAHCSIISNNYLKTAVHSNILQCSFHEYKLRLSYNIRFLILDPNKLYYILNNKFNVKHIDFRNTYNCKLPKLNNVKSIYINNYIKYISLKYIKFIRNDFSKFAILYLNSMLW